MQEFLAYLQLIIPTLPLRKLSPRKPKFFAQSHLQKVVEMGSLSSMSDSVFSLPRLPKETALLEFLQVHCEKYHTLNDYRKEEIILISLINKSQNMPAKVGFLLKDDSKVHGISHKQHLISESSLLVHLPSVSRWSVGRVCVKES